MPEEPESILERVEALERRVSDLSSLLQLAEVDAFLGDVQKDLFFWLFEEAGVTEIEGYPLREWWAIQMKAHVKTLLFKMEDKAPDAAAYLQDLMNRFTPLSKDRRGPDSPPE